MKPFDYVKFVSNKSLLKESAPDKPSAEEFDYMDRDQLGTHNDPLGPNENEEEDYEYEEDLFDDWENLPEDVKDLYLKWSTVLGGDDGEYEGMDRYKMMGVMQDEFEKLGYTFDWGLDAEPYGLKKMDNDSVGPNENEEYEGEDGFANFENLPQEVQNLINRWNEKVEDDFYSYKQLRKMQSDFEKIGWTFDWGLDASPY